MYFQIMGYKQKCLHTEHLQTHFPTRSFINPVVNSLQNFQRIFIKIIFEINHCFSCRIKINRSKFYDSVFFVFSQQNFQMKKKLLLLLLILIKRFLEFFISAGNSIYECMYFLIMDYKRKYLHIHHLQTQLPKQILHYSNCKLCAKLLEKIYQDHI